MSPIVRFNEYGGVGFPRVSGDEPARVITPTVGVWFSPRERG